MQQLEFLLEPRSMTILARFCQHCTAEHCIHFKILLITYKALNGLAPQYLREFLLHYSLSCPLHSQNSGHLIIPRISKSTAGGRSFSHLVPKLWNSLPSSLQDRSFFFFFFSGLELNSAGHRHSRTDVNYPCVRRLSGCVN